MGRSFESVGDDNVGAETGRGRRDVDGRRWAAGVDRMEGTNVLSSARRGVSSRDWNIFQWCFGVGLLERK